MLNPEVVEGAILDAIPELRPSRDTASPGSSAKPKSSPELGGGKGGSVAAYRPVGTRAWSRRTAPLGIRERRISDLAP